MIDRMIDTIVKTKCKESLRNIKERCDLPVIIVNDLMRFGKIPIFLFICIIVTSFTVVTTAHRTRLLTAQYEQLVLESNSLDIEWRNLILEENALSNRNRIERIAIEKLQMQHTDPSRENIIVKR